jgi:hypothetical protein
MERDALVGATALAAAAPSKESGEGSLPAAAPHKELCKGKMQVLPYHCEEWHVHDVHEQG